MAEIYRVVREDGSEIGYPGTGRRSDPFTKKASAKRRATQLTNGTTRYKVQVATVEWSDLNE